MEPNLLVLVLHLVGDFFSHKLAVPTWCYHEAAMWSADLTVQSVHVDEYAFAAGQGWLCGGPA